MLKDQQMLPIEQLKTIFRGSEPSGCDDEPAQCNHYGDEGVETFIHVLSTDSEIWGWHADCLQSCCNGYLGFRIPFHDSTWKGIILAIFFLVMHPFYGQEKFDGEVIYDVVSKNYSNKVEPKGFEMPINLDLDDDYFSRRIALEFNDSLSVCYKIKEYGNDEDRWRNFKDTSLEIKGRAYFNSKSGKLFREISEFGSSYIIEEDTSIIKWKLVEDEKLILGYLCKKAVRSLDLSNISGNTFSINYVAWYTPKISVSFGPFNQVNLPGLILEIEKNGGRTKFKYVATEINLDTKNRTEIHLPQKGIEISRKKYEQKLEEYLRAILGTERR